VGAGINTHEKVNSSTAIPIERGLPSYRALVKLLV
jgi:hypothetical protein